MPWILDRLAARDVRATFFVLGWLVEREPRMVRTLADAGHEVASHGWEHRRIRELTPARFRDSVRRTKALLEDTIGSAVIGYRAPSFSLVPGVEWALDILIEEGHEYDSSMFPTRLHRQYGYPATRQDVHVLRRPSGTIVEAPLATARVARLAVPAAGGAYGRFLPKALIRLALEQAQARSASATLYAHPWEWDLNGGDRLGLPLLPRLRLQTGRARTREWIDDVLLAYDFRPIAETVRSWGRESRVPPSRAYRHERTTGQVSGATTPARRISS